MTRSEATFVHTECLELAFAPDPVALFGELSQAGKSPNRLMLESADIVTRKGEKSVIMVRAALKATCRQREVLLEALSANGERALKVVTDALSRFVKESSQRQARLVFPKLAEDMNLADRLREPSSLDVVRAITKAFSHAPDASPDFFFAAGVFAYDLIDQFEDLPEAKRDELGFPDYVFWLPESLVLIDHRIHSTQLVRHQFGEASTDSELNEMRLLCGRVPRHNADLLPAAKASAALSFSASDCADVNDADFAHLVEDVKKRIVAGDVFQIVPSRSFKLPCADPLQAYQNLKMLNPSPYMYFVADEAFTLFGASPETFIKVSGEKRVVEVRPIAGTRRRGVGADGQIDADLDMRKEAELRLDEKELAEHMMLVDLARNDVARVSKPKTRYVEKLLTVDRYSHVMHLVSYVRGELRDDLDALHAYQASMNMGTLVGAPKVQAAQILREVERTKRGFYGGAVGYVDRAGQMDTAITIRSALVQNNLAHVRAGAGVVFDSIAHEEANESKSKAEAVLKAIAMVNP